MSLNSGLMSIYIIIYPDKTFNGSWSNQPNQRVSLLKLQNKKLFKCSYLHLVSMQIILDIFVQF